MNNYYARSDYALELLLTNRVITFDGQSATLTIDPLRTENQYKRYVIHTQVGDRVVMDREELVDAYTDGRLKFYELANVGSELDSALFDYD